jgi:hypothetical protein
MRKIILATLVLISSFTAFSQIQKNSIYSETFVGQRIGRYYSTTAGTGISIGLNEHSTLGIFYGHTRFNSRVMDLSHPYMTNNQFGVSYTYYQFIGKSKKWGWDLNASAALNRVRSFAKPGVAIIADQKHTQKEIALTPGIFYTPIKNVMLTANVGSLTFTNSKYDGARINSSLGHSLNLGIRITLFGGKKKR